MVRAERMKFRAKLARKSAALRDGEAVLQRDVVHQDAGHGQRGEAAGVGPVDDEGAHQHRVDARLVGQAQGRRGQQRHRRGGEGAQRRQRRGQQEEHPGEQHGLAPDQPHAGLDDDVDGPVPLGHAEEVGHADDRQDDAGREVRQDFLVAHAQHEVADAEGRHQPHDADVQRPLGGDDEHHHKDDERDDLGGGHGRLRFRGGRGVEEDTSEQEGGQTQQAIAATVTSRIRRRRSGRREGSTRVSPGAVCCGACSTVFSAVFSAMLVMMLSPHRVALAKEASTAVPRASGRWMVVVAMVRAVRSTPTSS